MHTTASFSIPPERTEICARCAFWSHSPPVDIGLAKHSEGQCRRRAPTQAYIKWQLTTGSDWCGEFSAGHVLPDPNRPKPVLPQPAPWYVA